jgi:uncharacterized coiled-coil protein SlyX
MALPQNPNGLTAGDRELLEASVAQSKNLTAQTKVLQKLSDNIKDQKKEYSKLRDDIKELRKGFYTGDNKGFAEIKKYFQKTKDTGGFVSRSKIGGDDKDKEQKGFFKNAMNKLFGPSKYQQKMMDDTAAIAKFTEMSQMDIEFIKKQYEEPERAKERELLAQAIADKINSANSSEGGGGFSWLKGILAAGFGAGIGMLMDSLKSLFEGFISNLGKIMSVLGTIIETVAAALATVWNWMKDLWEKVKQWRSSPTAPTSPTTPTYTTPTSPTTPTMPGATNTPALTGPETPKLTGPGGTSTAASSSIPKAEQLFQNKQGVYVTAAELAATEGMAARISSALGPIFKGLAILQLLIGPLVTSEEEMAILKAADAKRAAESARQQFAATDPRRFDQQSIPDFGKFDSGPGDGWDNAEKSMSDKIVDVIMGALKSADDALDAGIEEIVGAGSSIGKFIKGELNSLGEITMANGEKVNLLPNLGTGLFDILSDQAKQAKNYADELENWAKEKSVNIINQQNNVSSGGGSAPVILPSASSVNTRPEIQQMLMGGVVIGGRRYH